MANKKILWNKRAISQFDKAIDYISNDSVQNAEKIRVDILEQVKKISNYPEIYSPDRFKQSNDGNYRAFELHKYRVTYYVASEEIRILRIRHTSMEPKNY